MPVINTQIYMADSLSVRPKEEALIKAFAQWLPARIIDCHAHCCRPEHVGNLPNTSYFNPISTFASYTIEESEAVKNLFYPDKVVRSLRFPAVYRGINQKSINLYLLRQSSEQDRVAILGLSDDVEYTITMMQHPRVSALKMYHSYLDPAASLVYQFFKPEILEEAERMCVPIILHLPRPITKSLDDLRRVLRDFPNLKIVIAHLGPTDSLLPGLAETFSELAKHPYVYLDTSLNHSQGVIELALRIFGTDRLMYGSDEPLNLIRGRIYSHPEKGNRLITDYPYHWVNLEDHNRFRYLADGVPHWHWLALSALRGAISTNHLNKQDMIKEKIFHENAKGFFGF